MHHFLSSKIAIASISLCLSLSSFAQESSSSSADLKVQKEKLEAEQVQIAAMNSDVLSQQAKLNAELMQAQKNLNRVTINSFTKVEPKDLKSKEISMELPASKSAEIYIENSRNLNIKVWDQPKVKIVTTVMYDGDSNKVTDAEWFEKMNFTFRNTANSIKIKVGANGNNYYIVNDNNVSWGGANLDFGNNIVAGQGKVKKSVTIYVPKENNLDIDSKYAEISIDGNLNKLNVDITNGGLDIGDVTKLFLRSKYSNVNVGNIKTGEVELINGRFIAKDADDLDLDTKYATIEAGSVKKLMIRSTNDEYEMEEVGSITCRKNYGNLRITKLLKSMDLDGTNADVKIRNISEGVETIKINNKYADIRLPMRNVKNYTVAYQGPYSTVYSNFEKKPVEEKEASKTTGKKFNQVSDLKSANVNGSFAFSGTFAPDNNPDNNLDSHFTATVGDGKGAKLDLKCQNCTVDFK
jgi:hypothetical protein